MKEYLAAHAFAKINLYLHLTGKRADGYHTLCSVMQTVDLQDRLELLSLNRQSAPTVFLTCNRADLNTGEENLVCRAAQAFMKRYGAAALCMRLEKRIPIAAGLAGGSSDAAATLRLLNRAYGMPASQEELMQIAATLGADVPFCLIGGTALAQGVGERLTPLPAIGPCAVVIACGGEGISTPWAYGELDRLFDNFSSSSLLPPPVSCASMFAALEEKNYAGVCGATYNLFEKAILPCHHTAAANRRLLLESGADAALLSGSGPSVFGLFSSDEQANIAVRQLRESGNFAVLCHPIAAEEVWEK